VNVTFNEGDRIMSKYNKGDKVEWDWGQGTADGEVKEIYTEKVTKTIKGSEITRNASNDNPAYFIKQSDGSEVLKEESEVRKAT
jgi:hypothetical protein